jgi:ADP-ribosylglycohydrolase
MYKPQEGSFTGCLIGQCLGDALGFPVEGAPPNLCRDYVDHIMKPLKSGRTPAEIPHMGPFRFGQYTDDSQLARELMISYADCGRFDPEDYAGRIEEIFHQNLIVGRGMATDQAARRLADGIPWDQAGTPPPSAGNGSAMRAGPVGLICYDDSSSLLRIAHDQGRITHNDPRCSAGAVAIAAAVTLALRWPEIQGDRFLRRLKEWTSLFDKTFSSGLESLIDWVELPPEEAVNWIARCGLSEDHADPWQGISPFVIGSVLWSLYSFLRTPEDYWETISTAISVGGDVDTTAAMAGAISGAHLGLDAIPKHLAQRLTDRGHWEYRDLVDLARRCYFAKHAKPNWSD